MSEEALQELLDQREFIARIIELGAPGSLSCRGR
jgi:hypothetical protein